MFTLTMPWALILLLIPPIIWFFVKKAPLKLGSALKVPFFKSLLLNIEKKTSVFYSQKSVLLFSLIWILLVFAATNPVWIGEPLPLQREGHNILMVLDISGSMEVRDMVQKGEPVTRLTIVKEAAKKFIEDRKTDKIGLILFGSLAYLQTPLTYDHQNVLTRIEDAESGLAGNTTAIGDALGLAIKHLQNVPQKSRVIILLTDGASNSGVLTPDKASEIAANDGIKIYTIGLGADSVIQNPDHFFIDPRGGSDLDEETLTKIANETGGRYFRATDAKSLQAIYNVINQLEPLKLDDKTVRPQKNYYPWPLSLSLLLFFICLFDLNRGRGAYVG